MRSLSLYFQIIISFFVSPLLGNAQDIEIAKSLPIYFTATENQRQVDRIKMLPSNLQSQNTVILDFTLSCYQEYCDRWDRLGSFGIVKDDGQYWELMRFITPYGIGAKWQVDLSPFISQLQGQTRFRFFIDTWVGPGHPQGNGWLIDAKLHYSNDPSKKPVKQVSKLFSFTDLIYGDPQVSSTLKATAPSIIGFNEVKLHALITGHGQGNAENCAEFCAKEHQFSVGDKVWKKTIWRNDCETTVDPQQKGNWRYPRAGWCPGDKVNPWVFELTEALYQSNLVVSYQAEGYENSCRPGKLDCTSCVFSQNCAYDGGLHTEPRFFISAYLIYY